MDYDLIPVYSWDILENGLSEEEASALRQRLWKLLPRYTALYTLGDSSSVRAETAQELLSSIAYLSGLYLRDSGMSARFLLAADLDDVMALAVKTAERKITEGKALYERACLGAPYGESISLSDTLAGIGGFFRKYDCRFLAHQIPCSIDYQLCLPVPDGFRGVEYIIEYLHRLITENEFLRLFEGERVRRLLRAYCRDYRELLVNLCEPVLANAVGLSLIAGNVRALNVTGEQRAEISDLFERRRGKSVRAEVGKAAGTLMAELGVGSPEAREYLLRAADELCPRIRAARSVKSLEGIFLSFQDLTE